MDKSQKGHSELIIAGSDSAEDLKLFEKALNQVALLIGVKVAGPRIGAVFFGRDGVAGVLLRNIFPDGFRTIGLVSQDIASGNLKL